MVVRKIIVYCFTTSSCNSNGGTIKTLLFINSLRQFSKGRLTVSEDFRSLLWKKTWAWTLLLNVKILMSSVNSLLRERYIYPHISHFRDMVLQSVRQTQAIHWILQHLSHFIHIYLTIINPCYHDLHITWSVQFILQCTTISLFPKKWSQSKFK